MEPTPTLVDKIVGLLAKTIVSLWIGGFVLLLANSFVFDQHKLYLVALGAIRSGFLLALIVLLTIIGSVVAKKVRGRSSG